MSVFYFFVIQKHTRFYFIILSLKDPENSILSLINGHNWSEAIRTVIFRSFEQFQCFFLFNYI